MTQSDLYPSYITADAVSHVRFIAELNMETAVEVAGGSSREIGQAESGRTVLRRDRYEALCLNAIMSDKDCELVYDAKGRILGLVSRKTIRSVEENVSYIGRVKVVNSYTVKSTFLPTVQKGMIRPERHTSVVVSAKHSTDAFDYITDILAEGKAVSSSPLAS